MGRAAQGTFAAPATGLIANTGKGTVTGMLTGGGLARCWSHDRAHKFFSRAAWSGDTLGMYLSQLIVRTLLADGEAITVAVDDTLFKKRGEKVFGASWQHDGAARGRPPACRLRQCCTASPRRRPADAAGPGSRATGCRPGEIREVQNAWAQAGLDLAA